MKKQIFSLMTAGMFVAFAACASGGNDNATTDAANNDNTTTESTSAMETMEEPSQSMDIVDLAGSQDNLSTLVAAVEAAGLVETLKGEGPFTVFAPTNEAFAALPEGTLEMLLKPENKDKLVAILTYHVVSGSVESSALSDGMDVATVEGSDIAVEIEGESVMINNASVVNANVGASNGVVHVIDKVILPPNM
ncbi:fasciclin domain-containing protein [Catalinimonas locisalis]|uniref:fasciclin domain-containing protein n=1 Tax=Catalinimonas locisalis TaxID=3133978 RepID=UPI00403F6264